MMKRQAGKSLEPPTQTNGKYLEHQHCESVRGMYQTIHGSGLNRFTASVIDSWQNDLNVILHELNRLPKSTFKELMAVIERLREARNELRDARFLFDVEEINSVHRLVMRNRAVLRAKHILHKVILAWPQSLIPAKENRMNHESSPSAFEYDVALSFAREDKPVAEKLASLLVGRDLRVFRDEYTGSGPWGKDVLDHLVNLYARKARYCVLLISGHYPLKTWTNSDRTSARERSFRDANEFILPIRLDDTEVPGLAEVAGYKDLREHSAESIVHWLEEKLDETQARSGPPPQSHDLRSGNVPSQRDASDD